MQRASARSPDERSEIRGQPWLDEMPFPGFASLNPGYRPRSIAARPFWSTSMTRRSNRV